MPVAVVKLGSSVVAHDSGELRLSVVARVCEEVAELHRAGVDVVIVTSGAIARGMRLLGCRCARREIAELQAASAVGQGRLYRTYDDLLREQGLQTAQVLLTFFDMSARTHYLNARRTLQTLLGWRVVPVINENDTTTTDEISFGDNDFLAAQVAVLVGAELLVLLTDTDGLYTANPRKDPAAQLVEEVTDPAALDALEIGHELSPLGSGGMRSKVVAAEMATVGRDPGRDRAAGSCRARSRARGRASPSGTRFAPQAVRHSSFKLWLKYAKPAHGTLDGRRRRRARAARGRHQPAAGRDRRRRGRVRRRRRGRGARGRRGRDRQGDLQLLGGRAAQRDGDEERAGARAAAARDRRGRAPRLLRARRKGLRVAYPLPMAVATQSVTDLCRAAKAAARGWPRSTRRPRTARCWPSPTRSRRARPRSSRPTRATSRPGASPASRPR